MDKKRLYFYIGLLVITAALTAAAVIFGINRQISSAARAELARETAELETENENLTNREEILQKSLDSKQDETAQKDELNKKIVEITADMEEIQTDIADKESEISALKTKYTALTEEYNTLNDGMNEKFTASEDYTDAVLMCPLTLAAGRYKISGDGSFSITSISNSVRVAEDLKSLDTGSYIFEIEEGESVTVTGEAQIARSSTNPTPAPTAK